MVKNNVKIPFLVLIILILSILFSSSINALEINSQESISQLIKDHNSKYLTIKSGLARGYNKSKKSDEYVDITHFLNIAKNQFVFPLENDNYIITSDFGVRRDPFMDSKGIKEVYSLPFHSGLDLSYSNIKGDDVYSVLDGKVKTISRNVNSYGNLVIIDHNGMQTYYAHLDTIDNNLKVGNIIKAGDKIGTVGSTGRSTGAHLHIEFNIGNIAINPRVFLEGRYEISNRPVKLQNNKKINEENTDLEVNDFKLELLEIDNSLDLDEELDQIDVNSILETEDSFLELKNNNSKINKWEDINFEIIPIAKSEEVNKRLNNEDNSLDSKKVTKWSLLGSNDFEILRLDKSN